MSNTCATIQEAKKVLASLVLENGYKVYGRRREYMQAVIDLLLSNGIIGINEHVGSKGTLLHYAAAANDADTCRFLIGKGADKSLRNGEGKLPEDLVDPDGMYRRETKDVLVQTCHDVVVVTVQADELAMSVRKGKETMVHVNSYTKVLGVYEYGMPKDRMVEMTIDALVDTAVDEWAGEACPKDVSTELRENWPWNAEGNEIVVLYNDTGTQTTRYTVRFTTISVYAKD